MPKDIKLPKKSVNKIKENNLDKTGSKHLAKALKAVSTKKDKK